MIQQLQACGHEVDDYDFANGEQYDLTDDAVWEPLHKRIKTGDYLAIFSSPPCGTFSRVRNVPGGPPPLRGTAGAERYGLRNIGKQNADLVRSHNLLALRTAAATQTMMDLDRPAIIEQPAIRDGEVSMYLLDEFIKLTKHMQHTKSVQCAFGASAVKLTSWMTHGVNLDDMTAACAHEPRVWHEEGTGKTITAPHPPARGRRRFFATLDEAMQAIAPTSRFCTTTLSYYTPLLNRYLALKLKLACTKRQSISSKPAQQSLDSQSSGGNWDKRQGREEVHFSQPLRGEAVDEKKREEQMAIGGLRNTAQSLKKLTASTTFGRKLGLELMSAVTNDMIKHNKAGTPASSWVTTMCNMVGHEGTTSAPPEAVRTVRDIIVKHTRHLEGSTESVDENCTTDVDARLLESWRLAAKDPDDAVPQWLQTGAPAGTTSPHSHHTK